MMDEKAAAKKEYARQWRKDNREKTRKYAASYREKNKETLNKKRAEWVSQNQDKLKTLKTKWYQENKEKSAESSRRSQLRRLYGLTPEQRDELLLAQGSRCALCRSDTPYGKGWHVDHDHKTGKVRGILCGHCNLMLGYARDNPSTLRAAIQYLGQDK